MKDGDNFLPIRSKTWWSKNKIAMYFMMENVLAFFQATWTWFSNLGKLYYLKKWERDHV